MSSVLLTGDGSAIRRPAHLYSRTVSVRALLGKLATVYHVQEMAARHQSGNVVHTINFESYGVLGASQRPFPCLTLRFAVFITSQMVGSCCPAACSP